MKKSREIADATENRYISQESAEYMSIIEEYKCTLKMQYREAGMKLHASFLK